MSYPNPWKLAAVCLAAASAYLWIANRRTAAEDLAFVPLTSGAALTASPAISADGQLAAYASDRDARNLELYVQPIPSGMPVRLTRTPEDESEPAFSPDSGSLAFRSEKGGGGIYVMPARGGDAKLLAQGGRDPRYSPDGKWIAYWDQDAAWVIPSNGGTARKIFATPGARHPIWSPDGALVLAQANNEFVVGAVGVAPAPAGIPGRLQADSPQWTAGGLFFVERTGWVRNIWRIPLDARGRATAAAMRVTSGPESIGDVAVSRDGRILFTAGSQNFQVWGLPLDANTGKPAGVPQRLTDGAATLEHPAISADGRLLLYDAQRYGLQQLFLRDLASGEERVAAAKPAGVSGGQFLRGGRIIYGSGGDVYVTGESRKLAAGGRPLAVDRKEEIALVRSPSSLDALNLKSLERVPLLRAAISQAAFSPDDRWIAFSTGGRIYRAPNRGLQEIPRSEWLPVAAGDKPRFSPDGSLLYFVADGGIHAVRLATPGEPFSVWEPREPRLSLAAVNPAALELGIARDKLVVLLAESNFNLWMADRP
uniref:Periplasmic component of the Tol biopolymer transport system-like protein n=1 Tax=Solibacter usitatus (strain Ellin6076) TaxID=234267 RepID=Q01V31_SOLUE